MCEKQTRMRFHYSWRQFFASTKSENISVGLRIIPVPTKMILDSFWNNFRLVNFICEKQPKRYRQLRNIFGFYFWKFQKVSRMILAPSKNYQACAETILTSWHTPKQLFRFHRNSSGDLSLRYDSAVRNFSVSETFSVIFSQTPCLVFSR